MACHCERTARWDAFERCACIREDDRSFGAVRVRFVLAHDPGRLLTHQERAERRVSKCVKRHTWVGFGNPLSKDAGNPAVDVVHDEPRSPEVSNNILKQQLHGRWLAGIACVSTHAMVLLQVLEAGFAWVSSCNADRHAVLRKQPRTTSADAGSTPNDQCNVSFGRLSVAFGGCCHVSCSHILRRGPLPASVVSRSVGAGGDFPARNLPPPEFARLPCALGVGGMSLSIAWVWAYVTGPFP